MEKYINSQIQPMRELTRKFLQRNLKGVRLSFINAGAPHSCFVCSKQAFIARTPNQVKKLQKQLQKQYDQDTENARHPAL